MQTKRAEDLSLSEISELYDLYYQTYSKIGGFLFSEEQFKANIQKNYYDTIHYSKNAHGKFVNCLLIWTQPNNDKKICYVFGEDNKDVIQERLQWIKTLILGKDHFYIEASGPLGKKLLHDKLPVSLEIETNSPNNTHYIEKKTAHGKKIIFGKTEKGILISNQLIAFYIKLYEFRKIKLQKPDQNQYNSLRMLYDDLSVENFIPEIYRYILLNKIARKMYQLDQEYGLEPIDLHSKKSLELVMLSIDRLEMLALNPQFLNEILDINAQITEIEKQYIKEALADKRNEILYQNYLFESSNPQLSVNIKDDGFNPNDPDNSGNTGISKI